MHTITQLIKALDNLNLTSQYVLHGNPQTEEQFCEKFNLVVGKDEIGSNILSNDKEDWSFTWEKLLSEIEKVKLEEEKTEYKKLRVTEYPSIGDQLDALWKGGAAAAEMLAKIQAVKTKYPKPE
jgi:hypothetical protein